MMNQRVSLRVGEKIKDIFSIGYTSDGGFFFQDKVRINFEERKCAVIKTKTDVNHHGIASRKCDYFVSTSGDVKMAHHLDGRAHISGKGVNSGYISGNPKGAAIESFRLTETNDGGAVWTMLLWGIDLFRDAVKKSIVLVPDDRFIHSAHRVEELNAYEIKALYFLKNWFTSEQLLQTKFLCQSPIEGLVEVTLVPSPPKCPGIIGLFATRGIHGFNSNFGFSMSGAPSKVDSLGFCQGLGILYPYIDDKVKIDTLDFV
ncbi:MAG TPA: hypothetical protein PK295_01015 [Candidatus Magasanikbacteria bacterium]|nr:hypothetical protein [Candidatus Magasanikbacteria bacterium]